jgi:hypothetical protein
MKGRGPRLLCALLLLAAGFATFAGPAAAKAKVATKSFHGCASGPAPILDHTSTSLSVTVPVPKTGVRPQLGATSRLVIGIRATHSQDSDLSFVLVAPDATAYSVALSRGGAGTGYGTGAGGCSASLVLFGDEFPTPISTFSNTTSDPITGAFKPELPFSNLTRQGRAFGLWTLVASDRANVDTGTLDAFSLDLTYSYRLKKKRKR